MTIAEEFGKYLLLKKLKEDSLGETFRAGKAGKDSIEQVVLLRVFNGQGLNAEKLWQRISERGAIQQALRSPNIGSGVDLGRVRAYPYAAYDYISGKDLATLFAQAARLHSPLPTDHALLIAERLSLALAAAYETRVKDERILHGFVVPQLVAISNEGETRLLGFEVAPGLREVAAGGWMPAELQPYLAPETATSPVSKTDDVYSLGAIFYHLLTGSPLPPPPAEGYGAVIDGALLANEGTPLPTPIAALLKKSLTSRDQRIPDAVNWHKAISKLMIDGNYASTTFNLAFFMHNLFRDEIERESQEIQSERNMELPKRVSAVVAAAAAQPEVRDAGPRERTIPGTVPAPPPPKSGSKAGLWIGLAAVLLAALGAGGWFVLGRSAKPQPAVQQAQVTPPAAAPAVPAGPTPEEIQEQIQQIIEARSKEMQDKLRVQYDEQLKQLDRQLQESRRAAETERLRAANEASRPQAPAPAPAVVVPEPVPVQETPRPAPVRTEPAAPAPSSPAPSNPAPVEERPAAPAPVPQAAAPAPAPQRVQPRVQLGDLVQPGPDVVAPTRVSPLAPRYPPAARKFNKTATVSLRVLVDERGRVIQSEIIGERAGYGFDEAALDAARQVTFKPATKEGVRVKMWTTLRIAFKP